MRDYDYIIAGTGCAGLSLAVHMIQSGKFAGKKVLLADRETKDKDDRTWCFWEQKPGLFESIVNKTWDRVWFHDNKDSLLLDISPYHYKLIKGIDFYQYCLNLITSTPGFSILKTGVQSVGSAEDHAWIETEKQRFSADYVFNSIMFQKPIPGKNEYWMLQHFKGWMIEANEAVFNPEEATLMDFRTGQDRGTAFIYLMPFTQKKALIEYTLFSGSLLKDEEYSSGLSEYIKTRLGITSFIIEAEETGVIPMTNHVFPSRENRLVFIGTAGGQTKGSSGYTFQFIQKHSAYIVRQLLSGGLNFSSQSPGRFMFYDSILLRVLHEDIYPGHKIFSALFKKNKPQQVLKFLDNESSLPDEIKIISSFPSLPFLKALI